MAKLFVASIVLLVLLGAATAASGSSKNLVVVSTATAAQDGSSAGFNFVDELAFPSKPKKFIGKGVGRCTFLPGSKGKDYSCLVSHKLPTGELVSYSAFGNQYVILGGTGKYLGAKGSVVAKQVSKDPVKFEYTYTLA